MNIFSHNFTELHPVSDLVVQSFYNNQKQDVFKHMYRLAELNRLQQNFPYADQGRHRMLVAVSKATSEIVGFCDVDNRPSTPNIHYKHNPRPILSDLMVSPEFRRKGIARQLVSTTLHENEIDEIDDFWLDVPHYVGCED
jgi:ribosomal protein S18 acetylase RimI-like enzyme